MYCRAWGFSERFSWASKDLGLVWALQGFGDFGEEVNVHGFVGLFWLHRTLNLQFAMQSKEVMCFASTFR